MFFQLMQPPAEEKGSGRIEWKNVHSAFLTEQRKKDEHRNKPDDDVKHTLLHQSVPVLVEKHCYRKKKKTPGRHTSEKHRHVPIKWMGMPRLLAKERRKI